MKKNTEKDLLTCLFALILLCTVLTISMFLKTLKKKKNYFLFVLFTAFGTTLKVHCTKVLEKNNSE
jgi:hypothetical protein